jgi:mRNA interferase YafQ
MKNEHVQYGVIETTRYRRDLKKVRKWGYDIQKLKTVVCMLAQGELLPANYHDHPLKGKWSDRRECHITGDWVLVYRREEDKLLLSLMRTGRHTDIFEE